MSTCLLDSDCNGVQVGYLCARHYARLRSSILELTAVVGWLAVNIATRQGGLNEHVTGSSEDPIPLRTDILDLIGPCAPDPSEALFRDPDMQAGDPTIYDELRSWATLVEEESGADWHDRLTLTGTIGYLTGNLRWAADQPWVDEMYQAIRHLHQRAHTVAPWRAEILRDPNACETCGVKAIIAVMAEGRSVCERRLGGCGRVIVWDRQKDAG